MNVVYTVKVLQNPEEEQEINLKTYVKEIKIDPNYSEAIQRILQKQRIYVCVRNCDLDTICLMIALILKNKQLIPQFVFNWSEDRAKFFKHFYNGGVIFEGATSLFFQTGSDKYIISDFINAPQKAWNGIRGKFRLEDTLQNKKQKVNSGLVTRDFTGSELDYDFTVYIKTASLGNTANGIPEYYDYEDRLPKDILEKPLIIFVSDKNGLPLPERFEQVDYNIIPLISQLQIAKFEIINEKNLGLTVKINTDFRNLDYDLWGSLNFKEKRIFAKLFVDLIWRKFVNLESMLIKPDEFQREVFSRDGNKRIALVEFFDNMILDLSLYTLYNNKILVEKQFGTSPNIVFDITSIVSNNTNSTIKVFVPEDKIFEEIFSFFFSKDLFYSRISGLGYDKIIDTVKETVSESQSTTKVPTKSVLDEEDDGYLERIGMEEQYGEKSVVEIDCIKIVLKAGQKRSGVFIPLKSKASIKDVLRYGKRIKTKYTELKLGDEFEKAYWSYGRLITALSSRPEILADTPNLQTDIKISERFRNALESYINRNSKETVVKEISDKLGNSGIKNEIHYSTIVSWIEDIMTPILLDTLDALNEVLTTHTESYELNPREFINACRHIKSMRGVLDEFYPQNEERKIKFIVEQIFPGPFKVRGENVGKFYTIA